MRNHLVSLLLSAFLVAAFILAATTKQAHAYIDFGSGSMLLQFLFATLFGSLFTIKVFWSRITGSVSKFFTRFKGPKETIE